MTLDEASVREMRIELGDGYACIAPKLRELKFLVLIIELYAGSNLIKVGSRLSQRFVVRSDRLFVLCSTCLAFRRGSQPTGEFEQNRNLFCYFVGALRIDLGHATGPLG